jgi:hypothetical protein
VGRQSFTPTRNVGMGGWSVIRTTVAFLVYSIGVFVVLLAIAIAYETWQASNVAV